MKLHCALEKIWEIRELAINLRDKRDRDLLDSAEVNKVSVNIVKMGAMVRHGSNDRIVLPKT